VLPFWFRLVRLRDAEIANAPFLASADGIFVISASLSGRHVLVFNGEINNPSDCRFALALTKADTLNLSGLVARWMMDKWHGYRNDHLSLKCNDKWNRLIMAHRLT